MVDVTNRNAVPWGKPGDTDPNLWAYQDRYRLLGRSWGAGITGDFGAADLPWKVWCNGTDTVLRVTTMGSQYQVEGVHTQIPDEPTFTFDLAALGTQPASGQGRPDVLVLRYDPAAQDVFLALRTGTPTAGSWSTGGTLPTVTTNPAPDGVWEEVLAVVRRGGGQNLNAAGIKPLHRWVSPLAFTPYGPPTHAAPVGAAMIAESGASTDLWIRHRVGSAAQWASVTNPAWSTDFTMTTGYTGSPRWRIVGGRLEMVGSITRTTSGSAWPGSATVLVGYLPSGVVLPYLAEDRYGIAATDVRGLMVRVHAYGTVPGAINLEVETPATAIRTVVLDPLSIPVSG